MNNKLHAVYGHRWCTTVSVMLLMCLPLVSWAQSDNTASCAIGKDSTLMRTAIYFSPNGGDWIEKSEYKKAGQFLRWALADTLSRIELIGWADKSGTTDYNEQLSSRRARSIRNYLVQRGVSPDRIQFKGCGVDEKPENDREARRVDMIGLAIVPAHIAAMPAGTSSEAVEPVIPEEKQVAETPQVEKTEIVVATETVEPTSEPQAIPVEDKRSYVPSSSRWYIGAGGGVSFGRSTFCSFAMDGTRSGFNVGVLGGYTINRYLSAELSLDYTRMTLGTYDCCQNLWLASDGNRYFAPLAGATNYEYKNFRSITQLAGLGAHLNIDLVGIWCENSRWLALVSPAIYGVMSSAKVKQIFDSKEAASESAFHFGVGADLGVGYMITPCIGLRLKTGISLLTGKPMDGMPKAEHNSNYVWNNTLQLIIKL